MASETLFESLGNAWGTVSGHQLLIVRDGLRAGARMSIERERLPELIGVSRKLDLHAEIGFDAIRISAEDQAGGFAEWCERRPLRPGRGSRVHVYLSRQGKYAEEMRRADEAGRDDAFGRLLGYPDCCIYSFCSYPVAAATEDPVFARYSSGETSWKLNASLFRYDRSLLCHIPCSRVCQASERLAGDAYAHLLDVAPRFAQRLRRDLSCAVLHTARNGVWSYTPSNWGASHFVKFGPHYAPQNSGFGPLIRPTSKIRQKDEVVLVDNLSFSQSDVRSYLFVEMKAS